MSLECTHNSMFLGVLTGLGAGSDTLLKHFPWYLILSLAACAHLRIHISLLLVRVELKPPGPLIFSPLTTGCVWFGSGCHSVRSSRCCPAFSLGLADGSFPVWPLLGRHSQGCAVLQTDRDGYGFLGKPGLSRSGPRVSVRSEVVLKLHVLERFLLCVDGSVCVRFGNHGQVQPRTCAQPSCLPASRSRLRSSHVSVSLVLSGKLCGPCQFVPIVELPASS